MVARAQKRKWIDFVGGLLVGAAAQPLALLAGPDTGSASLPAAMDRAEPVLAQMGGSARARMALNAGIDAERLGDLDKAAALYHEVQARVNDLTPEEQRELDRRINANTLALQARREAREQLGLAESAFQHGKPADAAALLKKITARELYLSPADKQRFQSLCQRMHLQTGASSSLNVNSTALAHDKIRQARAELAQANLDAAEALILQVEQMRVSFEPREDTPRKIREDLDKARRDAKTLLMASRVALQRAEFDAAEKYARSADKLASPFTFMMGDSPAKVLKEIQTARSQNPTGGAKDNPSSLATGNSPLATSGSNADKARALVRQGREAFAHGDVVMARKCAEQAAALNAVLHWSEDNPEVLLQDIAQAGGAGSTPPIAAMSSAMGGAMVAPIKTKEEALALIKQGRDQLAKGQLEDANKTAARLRSARHIHWGLFFEDTPDKFQSDVDKARSQRDKHQAVELLAEARRRYEKKDYAGAEKLAYEARSKHGPYSIWDLGDRPDKLLADVQVARQHQRPAKLPDPPTAPRQVADLSHGPLAQNNNAVAQNNPAPSPSGTGIMQASGVVTPPVVSTSRSDPATRGTSTAPVAPVPPVQQAANTPQASSPYLSSQPVDNGKGKGSTDKLVDQTRARRLMAEARTLQQQNRLLDARDKIEEARRLGASFRSDEESPSQAYQHLAFQARQRIDSLVRHAGDTLQRGTQAPMTRCQDAERELTQARQLASAFGLDMQPIDAAMQMVHQLRATGNTTLVSSGSLHPAANAAGSPYPAASAGGWSNLLDQARLELRSGQTANARRFAEEAIKLGAGEAGLAVVRSIDTEEDAQNRRRANRAFDSVLQSYQHRDYRRASVLLASIDTDKLDERRRGRLREMLNTPEMQTNTHGSGIALTGAQQPAAPVGQAYPSGQQAGHARATDDPGQSLLDRTRAMREIKFQQLRKEGLDVQSQALERFRTGQTDVAIDMLQEHLIRLSEEQIDPAQMALLRRPIDSRLQQFQLLKAQAELANNRFDERSRQVKADIAKSKSSEQVKQKNIQALMKRYNELFREAKYPEAELVANQVKELDPDNAMAAAAITMAKFQRNHNQYENDKARKEDVWLEAMHQNDDIGDPDAVREGITFSKDQKRLAAIRGRQSLEGLQLQRKSNEERNILRKLSEPVSLSFANQPLGEVIEYIRGDQGINIFVDVPAIADKGIQLDSRVTIKLDNVSLKSALKLLLSMAHLTYVVADDVLKITTEDQARGKLEQRVYPVTDLVTAVEDFGQVGVTPNPMEQLGIINVNQAVSQTMPPMGMSGPNGMPISMPAIPPGGSMANGPQSGFASASGGGNVQVTKQRPHTHEDMLIKLITSTIQPHSWAEQGGAGTLEFHPITNALIINQTPDIQDQVQDLLNALRRLIDQEVAVEVKFISIAEDFFERIGVNFNLNILNKSRDALQFQPQLVTGQFANPAYINVFSPGNLVSGLTPAGTLTSDLNIPINQLTYPQAVPPFGGYPGIPGYGGLTMGLAFLSDIQVFLFMEAVAGDTRTNVMQAPKLTLFNGQTANISVQDFQFFTIGVSVNNGGFGQVVYNPITSLFPLNIILTIQAVISGDRRFVRLSLAPSLANVVNGEVNLFPVVTPIFPLFDGTATGQPVVFTQFIQQPRLTRVAVNTTVAVPDGGTVLMGGLKRLSEGRNEFGPPVLSKIPYLSRLFRNIGYGRSAESLLIMVTPRIIIQAEEEVTQTGYTPSPAVQP